MSGNGLARRDLVAIAVAGGAALLLFLSFVLDWVALDAPERPIGLGIDAVPTWGTAYVIAVMQLVALFVGVMTLPLAIGRAARVLGIGWAVGVGAIVTPAVLRLSDGDWIVANVPTAVLLSSHESAPPGWRAGLYCAISALVLMIAAFALARAPLRDIEESPTAA